MMRSILPTLLSLMLCGCTDKPTPDPPIEKPDPMDLPEQQLVVFDSPVTECPEKAPWDSEFAIAGADGRNALSRLCIYTLRPQSSEPAPFTNAINTLDSWVVENGGGSRTPDRLGPFPMADDLTTQADAVFQEQTGRLAYRPTTVSVAPVWLSIIDSAPTNTSGQRSTGVAADNNHGEFLAHLAWSFLCPPGSGANLTAGCPIHIRTRQALRRRVAAASTNLVGSLLDLSKALRDEIVAWEAAVAKAESGGELPPKLVLNLSIGWHHDAIPTSSAALETSIRLNLLRARCQGAEIVAAAGNLGGGAGARKRDEHLILPGAWMREWATNAACNEASIERPSGPLYPMLYAAGAVGANGDPLSLSRPLGLSGIVSPGDHAVAQDASGTAYPPMTGTSVSSIVTASGLSAMLYNDDPEPAELWSAILNSPDVAKTMTDDAVQPDLDGVDAIPDSPHLMLLNAKRVGLCFLNVVAADIKPERVGYTCEARPIAGLSMSTPAPEVLQAEGYNGTPLTLPSGATLYCPADTSATNLSRFGIAGCDTNAVATDSVKQLQKALGSWEIDPYAFPQPPHGECPDCVFIGRTKDPIVVLTAGAGGTDFGATVTQLDLVVRTTNGIRQTVVIPLPVWDHSTSVAYKLTGLSFGDNKVVSARLAHQHGDRVAIVGLILADEL